VPVRGQINRAIAILRENPVDVIVHPCWIPLQLRASSNIYLLFICAAIQLDRCCVCELVEVLSRNLVGGRTTVVLAVSGNFSWVISDKQYENYVELFHTFPTSTYALNLEL
jgi:hypothetical protein